MTTFVLCNNCGNRWKFCWGAPVVYYDCSNRWPLFCWLGKNYTLGVLLISQKQTLVAGGHCTLMWPEVTKFYSIQILMWLCPPEINKVIVMIAITISRLQQLMDLVLLNSKNTIWTEPSTESIQNRKQFGWMYYKWATTQCN